MTVLTVHFTKVQPLKTVVGGFSQEYLYAVEHVDGAVTKSRQIGNLLQNWKAN